MDRYDLMLYKLVNKYGIFLRGHAHTPTPICRKILSLAPRQKFLVTPLLGYTTYEQFPHRQDPSRCL